MFDYKCNKQPTTTVIPQTRIEFDIPLSILANFGALGKYNELYADEDVGEKGTELDDLTW